MAAFCCPPATADVFPGIVARNRAVLEYENFVHRTFYPQIIHPYSRFRIYWEIAMLFFIPFRLFVCTVLWVFLPRLSVEYSSIMMFFRTVNLVDVILSFFTGYVESTAKTVVLNKKKIALNYLLKRFIFDIIPCIPFYMIVQLIGTKPVVLLADDFSFVALYTANVIVVMRCVTFFVYLYRTSNLFNWYPFLLGLVCVPVMILLLFLFIYNCVHVKFALAFSSDQRIIVEENGDIRHRFTAFLDLFNHVLDFLNESDAAVTYLGFTIRFLFLVGIFFGSIFFVVYLIKICLLKLKKQEKFLDLENRIYSFAKKRHLSPSLKQKVLLYFLILLENKYYREDEVFHYIPNTFKAEIFFHLCLPLLKNFSAFENLPTYILRRLAECMTYQLYLPNQIVMSKDDTIIRMYFVQRGTVALYSANHVELYHFEAGSSINGQNFVLGELSASHYAISVEVTEVYRLDYNYYMDIMQAYPKLLKNIVKKFQPERTDNTPFPNYMSPWT